MDLLAPADVPPVASAAPRSVSGSSFPSHPLSYVLRAMHDLHSVGLRLYQEPNHVHIHDRYFLQVQNKQGSVMLELLFQFPEVLRLKVTNQTNRCRSTLRILFNLQCPPASIGVSSWVNATAVPTRFIESTQLYSAGNCRGFRNPDRSEKWWVSITSSAEATQQGGRSEALR